MGTHLRKYFKRSYYRKIEKRLDVKAILSCLAFNFGVAGFVFSASWLVTANVFATALYILAAWTGTLIMSVIYWLSWTYSKLKTTERIKIATSCMIILMLGVGLLVIWQTGSSIVQLTKLI